MPLEPFLEPIEGFNETWRRFIWGEQPKNYVNSRRCSRCKKRFKKGVKVYRRLSGKRNKSVHLYCESCFKELWI